MTPIGRAAHLFLLCHGATAATRRATFPADEALEPKALVAAAVIAAALPATGRIVGSPARCARETAAPFGPAVAEEPALRDCDWGCWRGRTLEQVAAEDPAGAAAWLADPDAAPHGGESLTALAARVAAWMEGGLAGTVLGITHPAVIRMAVLFALGAPATCFWRLDVAPLSLVELGHDGGRWRLRARTP